MRIISVDDEELVGEYMRRLLGQIEPEAEFLAYTDPEEAFAYLAHQKVDVALLDIELGQYNGLMLAKKCKDLCPQINIIFVTGHSRYTMEAFRLHASGYLLKPVRPEELHAELKNLRYPPTLQSKERVSIQTFGSFEIFLDGKPLNMPIAKCRECLAYLVDRKGARVTVPELGSILWEDRPYDKKTQNNTYRVVTDMIKYLKAAKIDDIVIKTRKEIAINVEKVSCDYYRFLNGDVSQINAFLGEYMTNYDWAEFTLAGLVKTKAIF